MGDAVDNPVVWFYASDEEAEWWSRGGSGRDETIAMARERWGEDNIFICQAKRMVPNLAGVVLAENVIDTLQDDECWGEDGWEGFGDEAELQRRLDETLQQWFAECCSLDGAQLDMVFGPEKIEALPPDTGTGGGA